MPRGCLRSRGQYRLLPESLQSQFCGTKLAGTDPQIAPSRRFRRRGEEHPFNTHSSPLFHHNQWFVTTSRQIIIRWHVSNLYLQHFTSSSAQHTQFPTAKSSMITSAVPCPAGRVGGRYTRNKLQHANRRDLAS